MNGLLVRVGIDASDGHWNAPVRTANGEFAYVPIPDSSQHRPGLAHYYDEFVPAVSRVGANLPGHLSGRVMHLDPDFEYLTYGDQGQRGARIGQHLSSGDFMVFFAALEPVDSPPRPLVYALIGLFVVDAIVLAQEIPPERWHENAHTRRVLKQDDIIVRAHPKGSGRLRRALPFGEYRNGAYRVLRDLLYAWGGLDVNDGYVQRSAHLPAFRDADRFLRWFQAQEPKLVHENNPV